MKKHLSIMIILALLLGLTATAYATETGANVVTKEYGDVKLHTFLSVSVSPLIVERDSLVLIDYPGDSPEQAAAFKAYVDGLGKPVDRIIISHVDAAHWVGIEAFFPDTPLYSVDADGIMALPEAAALTVEPIADDAELDIDGVSYVFETDREIGAWAIKLPAQQAVYVEHMGYVNLHVLIAPLEPRLALL